VLSTKVAPFFPLIIVGSGFHCLRSLFLLLSNIQSTCSQTAILGALTSRLKTANATTQRLFVFCLPLESNDEECPKQ